MASSVAENRQIRQSAKEILRSELLVKEWNRPAKVYIQQLALSLYVL